MWETEGWFRLGEVPEFEKVGVGTLLFLREKELILP